MWIVNSAQKMGCYSKGPRNLTPILKRVNNYAEYVAESRPGDYEVLVVILDGPVSDWRDEAAEELQRSSRLPLSIVFVTIGNADFDDLPYEASGGH